MKPERKPEPSRTETDGSDSSRDQSRDAILELRDDDRLSGTTISATAFTPNTEPPTHERLVCPKCKSTVLVPIESSGESSAEERVYCECDSQGIRMHRLPGPAGEVSL